MTFLLLLNNTRQYANAPGEWALLPLTAGHAAAELLEPIGHKDPFDELLLVQAQPEGVRLLTRDAKPASHSLAVGGPA